VACRSSLLLGTTSSADKEANLRRLLLPLQLQALNPDQAALYGIFYILLRLSL
jgi:hypothetical protein